MVAPLKSPYDWLTDEDAATILASDPGIELSVHYRDSAFSEDQLRVMQIVDGRLIAFPFKDGRSNDPKREAAYLQGVADFVNTLESQKDLESGDLVHERTVAKNASRRHVAIHGNQPVELQLAIDRARGAAQAKSIISDKWKKRSSSLFEEIVETVFIASWKRWLETINDHHADWSCWQPIPVIESYISQHDSKVVEPVKEQPSEHFSVPGFVNDVMKLTLETAPYPNKPLAFCGALSLLSLLIARKVTFNGLAPNFYLLALANSGSGKDWPRKVNNQLLYEAGIGSQLGNAFASGEGIEDALYTNNAMLFQCDEFDGIIRSMAGEKESRFESITDRLLQFFSSATTAYQCRKLANPKSEEPVRSINRPHLGLFATCVPSSFYSSLSAKMMTGGLMARMLVVDSGKRGIGQRVGRIIPSDKIRDVIEHWKEAPYGEGNLAMLNPKPKEIPATEAASIALDEVRVYADKKYDECFNDSSEGNMAVWARCFEHVAKLSLLYAVSANPFEPEVTQDAVKWARQFVDAQIQRMLSAVAEGMHETPFDKLVKRLKAKIATTKGGVPHSELLKYSKVNTKEFATAISTLQERMEIEAIAQPTEALRPGRRPCIYVLL
jgi:hypothetical protein